MAVEAIGVNYADRNAEYKDGSDAPANMSLFPRFARSFTGHGQPLIRPKASDKLTPTNARQDFTLPAPALPPSIAKRAGSASP